MHVRTTEDVQSALPAHPPKLLDQVRNALRNMHYSRRTEQAYIFWIRRYILFHNKRHPEEMAGPEIASFLAHLVVNEKVPESTQNQALFSIIFLYKHVLQINPGDFSEISWSKSQKGCRRKMGHREKTMEIEIRKGYGIGFI